MDSFLLEIVERIAAMRYHGKWVLLCYGGGNYEALFGAVPGEGVDQRWACKPIDEFSRCPTPNDALRAAIRDEMLEQWA